MDQSPLSRITVKTTIKCSIKKTWALWIDPMHIIKHNSASDDWHTTFAENHFYEGGSFSSRMEAKDGSMGFDFWGFYSRIEPEKKIAYTMGDGRKVLINFTGDDRQTTIVEEFDPESVHSIELQKTGWQSILDRFKIYAESQIPEMLKFKIQIHAPIQKVYKNLIEKDSYLQWTKIFNPTSNYIGDWQKGSTIRFIGLDSEGQRGGMISRVRENIVDKFISIQHIGLIQKDKEIFTGSEVEKWVGFLENYILVFKGKETTELHICIDTIEDFKDYFLETWPKALEKIKEISERS
jgi:uncharacterized protein YndB with AHSA1/START domain